jgi:hypothetical protein
MRASSIVELGRLSFAICRLPFADLTEVCADFILRECISGYDPSTQEREAPSTRINFVKKENTIMVVQSTPIISKFFQVVDWDTDTEGLFCKKYKLAVLM